MKAENLRANIINSSFDASSEAARNSSLSLYLGLEVFSITNKAVLGFKLIFAI